MSTNPQTKSFKGCTLFRHRIVAATLSGKAIRISDIRSNTVSPALSFRKLLAPRVLCDTCKHAVTIHTPGESCADRTRGAQRRVTHTRDVHFRIYPIILPCVVTHATCFRICAFRQMLPLILTNICSDDHLRVLTLSVIYLCMNVCVYVCVCVCVSVSVFVLDSVVVLVICVCVLRLLVCVCVCMCACICECMCV